MADKSVLIKIKRQSTPTSKSHWEEFELAWHPGMNVISCLMEIAANPVTREGRPTTPITYDSNLRKPEKIAHRLYRSLSIAWRDYRRPN